MLTSAITNNRTARVCDSWGRKESDTTERLNWTEQCQSPSEGSLPTKNPCLVRAKWCWHPEFLNILNCFHSKILFDNLVLEFFLLFQSFFFNFWQILFEPWRYDWDEKMVNMIQGACFRKADDLPTGRRKVTNTIHTIWHRLNFNTYLMSD